VRIWDSVPQAMRAAQPPDDCRPPQGEVSCDDQVSAPVAPDRSIVP
jgi:hypothetical protein